MSNKLKIGLLILTVVALVLVPETSALQSYSAAGGVSCDTCHVNSSGGGTLNAIGTSFSNQTNHANDPKAALIAIGVLSALEAVTPQASVTEPTVTSNLTNSITDVNETNENETNATEIANEAPVLPVNTAIEPATPVETTIEPTIPLSTPKPSPGFGIVMAIVVVLSIIYIFGKSR